MAFLKKHTGMTLYFDKKDFGILYTYHFKDPKLIDKKLLWKLIIFLSVHIAILLEMLLLIVFIIRKLTNTNENINKNLLLLYCGDIYWPKFPLLNPSVNNDRNNLMLHTEGSKCKNKNKKPNNTMTCRFSRLHYRWINLMIKFIREYTNIKLLPVYTDDITNDNTTRFKKANNMVTWHFYR